MWFLIFPQENAEARAGALQFVAAAARPEGGHAQHQLQHELLLAARAGAVVSLVVLHLAERDAEQHRQRQRAARRAHGELCRSFLAFRRPSYLVDMLSKYTFVVHGF